jgi:hypothetical protein
VRSLVQNIPNILIFFFPTPASHSLVHSQKKIKIKMVYFFVATRIGISAMDVSLGY